jgi:uncharacterized membrane protein
MQNKGKKKWSSYAEALFAGGVVLLAQGLAEWFSVYWHWSYARSVTIFIFAVVILVIAYMNRYDKTPMD